MGQQGPDSVSYSYDALYRLSTAVTTGSISYPKWGLSWTYDRYGNRLNQTQTYGNPPTNSLSFANPGGAQTNRPDGYGFDANGNLTSEPPPVPYACQYDAENRQLSVTTGGATGNYSYDGNGLRVKKVSGGTTTVYIFSGAKVIAEYDNGAASASPSREYMYSGSQLLAKIEGGASTYYHADHLSARVMTDSSGNTAAQRGHYPYGETWYETGATTKWKFTSYERDSESWNDYAMARYHINRFGRFASPDPVAGSIADPQSLNRYAYALNDPANLIDPVGLYFQNVVADPDALGKWFGMAFSFDVWHSTGGYWNEVPYADPIWVPTGFWETISFPFGGFWPGGDPIDKARNQARALLSDPDCAKFLKGLLSNFGFLPNLDNFLALFNALTIVPTPPGDKGVGYPTTAHVDEVNAGSTVHVDVPSSPSLPQVLLHETFHTLGFGVYDYGLAKAVEKDVKMKPDPKNDELNSRIATAAFNKHCKPK